MDLSSFSPYNYGVYPILGYTQKSVNVSYIYPIVSLDSRMNSEVHNDTAPDSGGGVSAFETMVTEYREGQEETRANNRSAPRVGIR